MKVKSTIDFGRASQVIRNACIAAMPAALSVVGSASKAKAPHDRGDLIGSEQEIPDGLTGKVVFTAPHAVYQHEGMRLDGTHVIVNRPAGGESKFLESVINDDGIKQQVGGVFGDAVKNALG